MPTGNKSKSNQGTKNVTTKNSNPVAGIVNTTASRKARDMAKDMDSKRRGDSETFGL